MNEVEKITLTLTYEEVMALIGAANYRASRLANMADMTDTKQKSEAMSAESTELALLAGKLMQQSSKKVTR